MKIAMITGCVGGIGRATVEKFIENGYFVVGMDVCDEAVAYDMFGKERFAYLKGDLSVGADREAFLALAQAQGGVIWSLVNVAGVAPRVRADLLEMTEESYDRVMGINLKGAFFLTQQIAKRMAEQKNDVFRAVVFITSISAEVSSVNRGEYCISKAGLSMAATLYADRLAEYGIRVYEVRPGVIATDMTAGVREKYDRLIEEGLCPIRRIGQPEDVGKAVLALADGAMAYSTGLVIGVDGGMTIQKL